jgi:predicted protein tyrosine phosphatase
VACESPHRNREVEEASRNRLGQYIVCSWVREPWRDLSEDLAGATRHDADVPTSNDVMLFEEEALAMRRHLKRKRWVKASQP